MMTWALSHDGVVLETTQTDPTGRFHPSLSWRRCAPEVKPGWLDDGPEFSPPPTPVVDLVALKSSLKSAIDDQAERQRLLYMTGGAGQAMTYARKVEQAKAVQAADNPQPADYPLLAASIGIDGEDLADVASVILAMDAAWEHVGAAIEGARLAAKRAIDLAENAADAQAVQAAWPG